MERIRGTALYRKQGITGLNTLYEKKKSMSWQRRAILLKFWLQRTMGYAAVANFCMLLYLILDKWHLNKWWIPLIVICLVSAVLFGCAEDKIGLAGEEYLIQAERMGLRKCS